MVDQDETAGLVLAVFTPQDIGPGRHREQRHPCLLAYPDNPERAADAQALGAASHMAALDPQAAVVLAAWLDQVLGPAR